MTMRKNYEEYMRRREALAAHPMRKYWIDQESRYVEPFRLYGNVWYVGDSWVCAHLIDTGDGLLLIDAGNCGATAMLIQTIWQAGFRPQDVKWCILSHGHVDHIGGACFLRKMFGTKLYLGEPDARMFRERPELSLIQDSPNITDQIFEPDEVIRDGDVLTFGGATIQCYLVPGHTEGCVALFFDAHDGEEVKRCGYYGGFGFNTLQKDFLLELGDKNFKTREIYLHSLAHVREQRVEVFLGNHVVNNQTLERRKKQLEHPEGPNPFVDPAAWGTYLDEKRAALLEFMANPVNS